LNLNKIKSELEYLLKHANLFNETCQFESELGIKLIQLLKKSKLTIDCLKDNFPAIFSHIDIDDEPILATHVRKGKYYSDTKIKKLTIDLNLCLDIIKKMISENKNPEINSLDILESISKNFSRAQFSLQKRYNNRRKIEIVDEYDVQDIFYSYMKLFFDDVRKEIFVPEFAGSNSRLDFLLPNEKIGIEIKKARPSLTAKQLGEELIIDRARYNKHLDINLLFCFVNDENHIIINPISIENDLARDNTKDFSTIVRIYPKI
jgi:hypothetical protein